MLATYSSTPAIDKGAVMVTAQNKQLRPELEQIVDDIFGLRALASTTGFMTYKSQRDLLAQLSPKDQAAVGRALHMREKQQTK
jgi:hypothetical protein